MLILSYISMVDNLIFHLLLLKSIFQIVQNLECDERGTERTTIHVEWDTFPEGQSPDYYFVTFESNHDGNKQNSLKKTPSHQVYNSSILLDVSDERHVYNLTIKSMKDGNILAVKSLITNTINLSDITTLITSTSVSFNWNMLRGDFYVTIILNKATHSMSLNDEFYEWDNLIPGNMYNFVFFFKQRLGNINVSQSIDVPVETGLCSDGWLSFKNSCYRIVVDSKDWENAGRSCEMLYTGAHLVNIHSGEEHHFLSSYLRNINEIILLWSGLADRRVEGELLWTDGSFYNLDKAEVHLLSTLSQNETDCYALQQNATGPNYFYTAFFCQMDLPYICEYELPLISENVTFALEDTTETEVILKWNNAPNWSKLGYYPLIKYFSSGTDPQFENVSPNMTEKSIHSLFPGHKYSFIFCMKNKLGTQLNLSPVLSKKTRPSPPINLRANSISSTSIVLEWEPPGDPFGKSFCGYLLTLWDVEENTFVTFLEPQNITSLTITNVKPYHEYNIVLQTMTEGGKLSFGKTLSPLITGVSPPQGMWIDPAEVEVDYLILHWEPLPQADQFCIQVKALKDPAETVVYFSNNTKKMKIGSLEPGMTYEIGMSAVQNGNMSEMKTIQQTLRPRPVTLVIPFELNTHTVVLFVQMPDLGVYDGVKIICRSDVNRSMSFPLKADGKYTIDKLIPGTDYEFSIHTQSKNMLSIPYELSAVKTCLASPSHVHEGMVTETSIQIVWERAEGNFQQYEIICKNCSSTYMVQKVAQEEAVFLQLMPGTVYSFSVRTEKEQFKDSHPVTIHIQTVPSPVEYMNCTKDSGSITVRWSLAFGQIDSYIIFLESENINRTVVLPPTERMYRFNELSPGVEHLINIVTTYGPKKSSPTVVNVSTDPEPPSELQVFAQEERSVYVSWKLPRGRYHHFQLTYQAINDKATHRLVITGNESVVKNLSPGTVYRFQVRTLRGTDASSPIEKVITTRPPGICGLNVKAKNTSSATLEWNPVTSHFTRYRIVLSNHTLVREYNVTDAATEYTVSHLTPGGIYNVTVQRIKEDTEGALASVLLVVEPEKPLEVRAFNISSESFSLCWEKPYGLVERYRVDLFPPHGFVTVRDLGGGEYQADVSSTAPGTTYAVTISSVSSSALSSPVSKSVITNETIPGPPLFLAGERVGSAGILLSWNIPRNPNGKLLAYYVIYREVCPWVQSSYTSVTTTPDSLEVLLTSLTPGTTYEIKVAAENSAGIGAYSEPFLFQTAESAPGKVVNLTVEALNSSAVNLTWFLPRQPHGKITSFKISVKHARSGSVVKDTTVKVEDILNGALPECNDETESFLWSTTSPPSTRGQLTTTASYVSRAALSRTFNSIWNEPITFIVGQLRPYTTYLFEVSAVTSEPGYIDSTIVRTPESVPEDPPQNLMKGNITARSFSVTWDAPTIVTGKFSYRVELYGPTGRILDNSTKDLRFIFTNLTPFTTYDAFISGETSAGVGPRANISVFTPAEVPSAVSDLNAKEVEASFITIDWRRPQQPNGIITQYRVKVLVKDTGMVTENTILTGKNKDSNSMEHLGSTTVNEVMRSQYFGQGQGGITGVYEGSGDIFSTMPSMSSVTFYTGTNGNIDFENIRYGIDIEAEQLTYMVEKLTPYTEYMISVSAFTTVGEGPPTDIVLRTSEQVPSSVQNIRYQNISSTSVMVYWDPPLEPNGMITHYTVYAMELHTSKAFRLSTSNNSILITGLKMYTDYKMRVTASTTAGESSLSEVNDIFVRTLEDVPGSPPQNLVLIGVNATGITLEWSSPSEPNGIITQYEIICTNSTTLFVQNTTSTSYTLIDLNPYTLYNISVRAYTRFGHGNQTTSVLSVRTSETAPSSPPYNLLYRNISSTRVMITWLPPLYANGIILFYKINYWNSTHSLTSISNDSLIILSGLKKYSQYQVVVSGHTIHGDGNQTSDILYMTTMEDVPDDAPHNLSYRTLNSTSIQLFFYPPSSPNGIITYYSITCLGADGRALHFNSSSCSVIVSGLKKYGDYAVAVRASTSMGTGMETSSPLFVRTDEDVPDSSPENITYRNISSTEIVVSFSPPLMPNGIIRYYTIYIAWLNGTMERTLNTTNLSANVTGLKMYTRYILRLSASTIKGEGILSVPYYILTEEDVPSSPPLSLYVKQLSSRVVKLSWKPPLEPNGIILFYTVFIWNDESNKTIRAVDTVVELMDLENNKEYNTYITTSTRFGDGNVKSNTLKFRTSEGAPSDPPKNVSYRNITSTSIMVFWIPPTKPNGVIQYYSVYYKNVTDTYMKNVTDDDISSVVYNSALSAIIDGLSKYSQYNLWMTASTAYGDGNQSSEVIFVNTEQDVPETPPIINYFKNITSTSVLLSWDQPVQPNGIITGYNLQIYGPQGNYSVATSNTSTILKDLMPFTRFFMYLAARTVKGTGPSSQLAFHTDEAEPSTPPQNLTFINASENAAWLKWSPSLKPNGFVLVYSFKVVENSSQSTFFQNISGEHTQASLTALEPFKTYLASISAFTRVGNGNQFSNTVSFTTKESAPDSVQHVHCVATSWQSVLVQWDPPLRPNGLITHYILTFQSITTRVSSTDNAYTFRDLLSNSTYHFTVKAANSAGEGIEQVCNATTKSEEVPGAPRDITLTIVQSTSITLQWNRPDNTNGYLRSYRITTQLLRIECNDWDNEECIHNDQNFYSYDDGYTIEKTIYGLKKFRRYRFKVSASTSAGYGASSPWIQIQTLSGPVDGPPENVTVIAVSHESLNISWNSPSVITGPTSFIINVSSVYSEEYTNVFIKGSNESQNIVVSELKPFTMYSVVVTAFTGDLQLALIEGQSSSAVFATTLEAVPNDPPKNVTIQKIPNEVTKVQMTFIPPAEPNGKIQVFQAVVSKENDPSFSQIHNLSIVESTNDSVTTLIEGLKGGHTYNIKVYAVNGAGAGPNVQMKITTDIKAPPKPIKKPVPMYDTSGSVIATSTTVTIKMPVCYFSEENGPIKNIQILVSEIGAQHDGNITKWHEAYFKKPKPYFTSEGFPNPPCLDGRQRFFSKEEIYVIGADNTCILQDNEDKFCNGPLKPRKQYLFKFRATNIKGQYTDSEYSETVKTLAEGLSERAVEIILSVTLCVLSVILLVAAIYAFARIRQKQKEGGTYSPRDAEIIDTKFKLDQLITVADLELKDERLTRYSSFFFRRKDIYVIQLLSYRKSLKPVSKKGFLQHVEELCTNNNLKFQEEFSELPRFLEDLAISDADLPWNRPKNRFTNIKPYNNNRVKLIADAGVPGSDYINASYVSGYICPNEFIATQGPLAGTVGDFWRMVWETRAKTIVMLTQCFEKSRVRCHQYWPEDNKPVTVFGDIVITKVVEDVQIDWTTRDLKVERHGDFMMVRQCNFTSWPEHGVPENTTSLIHFVKMVRANRPHENTPAIVHCSAGVGRTGVFIALDHLVQHINHHDFVDIYGLIAELRSERMCMVQNLAQYIFLHQCVADLLASKGSNQPAICFLNYSALQKMDSLDAMEGDVELEWEETTM
ncbi:phosphatidylinositol phosphatase PTPRQ [Spea bombifrons]|uniref:phosphatidylinositol phosphatase PTPRQ n=1 Tax=Spea bombifrons TaxID=233779 RepID=UPI002349EDE9|nr:phosphatidylinositol phosphatase PTPRQ [Spea bombifrons]